MSNALAVVDTTSGFRFAPADAWFATYEPQGGNLVLHFRRDLNSDSLQVSEICQVRKSETGAVWYTVNGEPCTLENVKAMEPFAVLLSSYHVGTGYGHWVKGQDNIKPFEALLSALGDTASAQKIRDTFPKIFAPPAPVQLAPQPAQQPQRSRRRRWWPF